MFTIFSTDQGEPPLIAQARATLRTAQRVLWLQKKLMAPKAYRSAILSLTAVMVIALNPVTSADALAAAGSVSETTQLSDFEFISYEEVTLEEELAMTHEDGFAPKPTVVATEMGRPEKELIARQERERREAEERAIVAARSEAARVAAVNAARNRRGTARRVAQAAPTSSTSTPIATGAINAAGNTYAAGYCTWWAKSKRPDLPNQLGNAGRWLGNAQGAGLPTGQTPKPGAVVVTREGPIGHVGYVESVNGDEMTVSDMNMIGRGKVSRRTMSASSGVIKGYIY